MENISNWEKQLDIEILTRQKASNLIGKSDDYYVYIIWKMYTDTPIPFYVGKGHWQRLIKHEMKSDYYSNHYKTNIIKKHKRLKIECGYSIVSFHDDENRALEIEVDLIELIGRADLKQGPLSNKTDGGDGTKGHLSPKGGDSHSARPVVAEGIRYGCLKDAGLAHDIEPGSISSRIKNGWKGYYYEDEGQRKSEKIILGRYKKKVSINGVEYESASEASRQTGMDVRMIVKRISYGWVGYLYLDNGQLPRKTLWTDRDDKVPVVIKGKNYSTVAEAVKVTGESLSMISKRCLSSNFPNYSRVDGKLEIKSSPPRYPEVIVIDTKRYKSISIASQELGLTTGGVAHRCKSSNYPNWKFENQIKQTKEGFTAPFSSIPVKVKINGIEYESQSNAALEHNIDVNTLKKRCKSQSFPSWICDSITKCQPKDGRPGLINVEIDGISYRSISEASRELDINRNVIKKRIVSREWPDYK